MVTDKVEGFYPEGYSPSIYAMIASELVKGNITPPAEYVACGPDPDTHIELLETYANAGFDHVYVPQDGPDQAAFFDFYEREILPSF